MVGLDLETQRKGEEHSPEYGLRKPFAAFAHCRAIGIDHSGEHPGEIGYGLHLGVVAHLDNLHIVGTEGYGYGTSYGRNDACSEREEEQEASEKSNEEIGGGTFSREQEIVQPFGPVSIIVIHGACGGHSGEH